MIFFKIFITRPTSPSPIGPPKEKPRLAVDGRPFLKVLGSQSALMHAALHGPDRVCNRPCPGCFSPNTRRNSTIVDSPIRRAIGFFCCRVDRHSFKIHTFCVPESPIELRAFLSLRCATDGSHSLHCSNGKNESTCPSPPRCASSSARMVLLRSSAPI